MSKAPKSRFRSVAGKKIEKQVIKDATRFHPYASHRRGYGVASGANHRGKPVMDSNIGHKSNILSNEKLASSSMNASKTNKRDDAANDANWRDNVVKHSSLATLSRNDNKRSFTGEANQQVNHALRPIKQDPPRKNTNTKRVDAIMPNRNLTPLARSCIKSCQLITPLSDEMRQPTTSSLKNFDFDGLDGYNDALPSKLKRQVSLDSGGGFVFGNHSDRKLTIKATEEASPKRMKKQRDIEAKGDDTSDRSPMGEIKGGLFVGKHSDGKLTIKATEEAYPKQMKKQRNTEAKGDDTSDRSPMGEINGDLYPFGVKDYSERNLSYGPMKRQRGNMKTNEDEAIDNGDMKLIEVEDGGTQLETHDRRPKNKKKRGIESNEVGDGESSDSFTKKNLESLPKDHLSLDCSNEAIEAEKLTHRKLKKRRQDIIGNEDEELHVDGGDHSPLDADGDSSRFTSQAPILIDCLAEVPAPFVLEHVKQQCNYCSKPIDKPIWSGIFKIDGKEYISLAGHLSTKSCDKVWKLSRSLVPVVEVTKLSRSKFKIWETSKPSCDSIGLYFFHNKMRHDEDLDKLVKEVIEDDLVLQTVIGEAEMLIFPSTLLPERYKTFQRKHYLWGVFRPRQDKCATVAELVHDTVCHAPEKDKEEQHASNQQDEVQEVHWKSPAKSMQQAAATRGVPWSPDIDMVFRPEAPEERQLGDALRHTLHSAEATAVATNPAAVTTEAAAVATNAATGPAEATENDTNAATIPAEYTENGTNAATIPGNHGRSDSVVGVPPGRFFCFVAEQTPKLEQLIEEMQREGSLVLAVRGEAIGAGVWPGNIAPTNISRA